MTDRVSKRETEREEHKTIDRGRNLEIRTKIEIEAESKRVRATKKASN